MHWKQKKTVFAKASPAGVVAFWNEYWGNVMADCLVLSSWNGTLENFLYDSQNFQYINTFFSKYIPSLHRSVLRFPNPHQTEFPVILPDGLQPPERGKGDLQSASASLF